MQQILGWLFLALAALAGFAQTHFLLTLDAPESLRDFAHSYAIRSSIECYGFAISSALVGASLLRRRERFWPWVALAVATVGFWLFVARELWDHFVVLPRMRHDFLATYPYVRAAPLSSLLPKLAWHILLPVAVVLSAVLAVVRYAADDSVYPSDEPNADTPHRPS
jgi:hypothetical protein